MHDVDVDARAENRRRWKWLGVLSVAALLLHAAAFSGLDWSWPQLPAVPLPAATMRVRVFDIAPPVAQAVAMAPVAEPPKPVAAARPVPAKPAVPRPKPLPAPVAVAVAAPPTAAAPPASDAPGVPVQLALTTPQTSTAPAPPPDRMADEAIPHYRTRLPPAMTLRYEMQRGLLRGTGDLSWLPQGDRYELRLEARVAGLAVLTQVSTGGFDADGVAPVRFTDQRLRRAKTAANFQRAAGTITFSGPATEFALRAGAQDRLSWMVQLAAIVAAEPQLGLPGAKVAMYVVGTHGDAGVWVFRCIGTEAVATGAGTIDAIKFMREPREAYDTTVQVWLDPRRHYLPVLAMLKSGPNDEGYELRLQEVISN